jgi:hypothetical protein
MLQAGILTGLTLEELRAMNLGQITAAQASALAGKDKKWRIEFELQETEFADPETGENGPHGQIWRLTPICDAEENVLKQEKTEWTYYNTGEVDTITISILDSEGWPIYQKKIKHFKTGKQPIIIE